ncbi:pitrilysin family protein [uncultured Cetobacterium sp.]|uniref:M16 family metallopeptidase n=1 Tax=uncultured Cetobacterium sp. TaxID=527638 RepID=UPI00260F0EAC|nr:M16 family metallopeptidase [uncultured Cetobacterium sp.]
MLKKNILYFFCFITIFSLSFSENLIPSSDLISGKLDNGLKYYILKNKKPEQRASLNLIVSRGSLAENDTQQGLAHFLEHMAFNGTKKYKKNELVKYLQSLGLKFGGDLNAYTSFNETVYELKVPSSIPDLKIALDVLKEWSANITLNQKDINDEKNIILEEWRLRQGIAKRIGDIQQKILFGDSFYSKRFPIGKTKIIETATKENLEKFYLKNYQPKNMAIVIVGDFNPHEIIPFIKKTFKTLENTDNLSKKNYQIPIASKNSITVFTDPEITKTKLDITWKYKTSPVNSIENYKKLIVTNLLDSIINSRLNNISLNKDSPFIYSSMYNFNLNTNTGVHGVSALIKNNNTLNTTKIIFENLKDISLNGIHSSELNGEIKNEINNAKFAYNNRDSISNSTYLNSIRDQILENNTFLTIKDDYKISSKILKSITDIDIKNEAKNIINRNYDILITSPENNASLPNKKEIENTISQVLADNSIKININSKTNALKNLNLSKGNIISETHYKDYSKFILSNGLQVLYKKTAFDKDKIFIDLTKYQGSSNYNFNTYINSLFLTNIVSNSGVSNIGYKNLNSYFKGKNFSVTPFISDYSQGFTITSDKENLSEALNYFENSIYKQNFSNEILNSTLENYKELIKNQNNSPMYNFKETYLTSLNSNNPRRKSLTLKDLSLVSLNNIKNIYDNMINFNNYKISIVGSLNEEDVKTILENNFANLPTKNNDFSLKNLNIQYPKNIIKKEIIQGIDKKSTVIITLPYHGKVTKENTVLYKATANVLNTLLLENIREKNGEVYSISTFANIDKLNYGENYLQIYFSTNPKNIKTTIKEVFKTINSLQKGKFKNEKIKDIKENYRLNFETALKTNDLWLNYLNKKNLISDYEFYSPMLYNNIVDYKSIVNFSQKSIDKKNYVEVILLPKKEG